MPPRTISAMNAAVYSVTPIQTAKKPGVMTNPLFDIWVKFEPRISTAGRAKRSGLPSNAESYLLPRKLKKAFAQLQDRLRDHAGEEEENGESDTDDAGEDHAEPVVIGSASPARPACADC